MTTPVQAVEPEQLITLRQAEALGYGKYSTLRKYVAEGTLPAVRIGTRSLRIRPRDLAALAVPTSGGDQAALDAAIDRLVGSAPALSDEQVRRLSEVLGGEGA